MAACAKCGAVYHNKRWTHREDAAALRAPAETKASVLCPACQKIRDKYAQGFVTLQGAFVKDHKEELLNLVRNKETLSSHTNPLARIMEIKESRDSIEITTTSDKLAQRIGRVVAKAFSGEGETNTEQEVKLTRVIWTRN